MSVQHLHPTGAACPRIYGIDVDRLLRDLGEASVVSSSVDLFGLLLNAQRVLVAVQAGNPDEVTSAEGKRLTACRATADFAQRNTLLAVEAIAGADQAGVIAGAAHSLS